ncbi:SUKH-4 family immunity protein [Micromonospora sp. HK10]|uniref:SUKH-4 family immunity protein n=1 Tax=Micromonospora sp. HK10 TaxID=1538294 RepID=UPI000AF34B24|nr:SUKH-4 family immunity protein [Micromonospora sp. HK10]
MTVTHADLLALWSETHVRLLDREAVDGLGLPDDAVRVLVDVGLPVHVGHYGFEPVPPRLFTPASGTGTWCQIGRDEGGDFSLDLATEALWSCVDTPELPTRFVNTTVSAFVELLCSAVRGRRDHAGDVSANYDALHTAVSKVDPRALDDDENYWSVILEQMEIGLF